MLRIAYDPIYQLLLPEGHRFPMLKYELIPAQLIHEGVIAEENLFTAQPCLDEVVLLTHTAEYLHRLKSLQLTAQEQRRIGFPQSAELITRELIIAQGTIDCALHALSNGISMNVAGGTHHAFADKGEGFCILNDIAIAANYLLSNKLAQRILIIDLDVHQGNGTASIFRDQKNVFTFSMHGEHNYPFHKEQSDMDIGLPAGIGDEEYLGKLDNNLKNILSEFQPDFSFYLSGVDILSTDRYGKLNVSINGCKERDRIVFARLKMLNIPCAVAMGGGYSADIRLIVEAHCNTFKEAANFIN